MRFAALFFFALLHSTAFAQMSGGNFTVSINTISSAGQHATGGNFALHNSVGQKSSIGAMSDPNNASTKIESGFLYSAQTIENISVVVPGVQDNLTQIVQNLNLTGTNAGKNIGKSITFLDKAIAFYDQYLAGDFAALSSALIQTKNAINKLDQSGLTEVAPYKLQLATLAQSNVLTEMARVGSNPTADNFYNQGLILMTAATPDYNNAVKKFNNALNAL